MNIIKYLTIFFLLCLLTRCTSEGNNHVKIFRVADFSDFHVYAGSIGGGKELTFATDSIRKATAYRFLGNLEEVSDLYKNDSFEFFGNKITYTYYDTKVQTTMKILSDYKFRNDTLYVHKSDGSDVLAAYGNSDRLYQTRGLCCYPVKDKNQLQIYIKEKSTFTLDSVMLHAGYKSIEDLKTGDTIAWCNLKYIFE